MYAAVIGRKFLNLYNEKMQTELSAREFFEQIYAKTFFDYPKYMMTGGNSPLENPKIQWKKGMFPNADERRDRIAKTISRIEKGDRDASIAIGFPATENTAPTSGQVTGLVVPISKDDVYFSWIGSGLGVGIAGGLSIFFEHPDILWPLFEGWKVYRDYLNDPAYTAMRGNQINTWNGQWLVHYFSKAYRSNDPTRGFNGLETSKDGTVELATIAWTKLLIAIAKNIAGRTLTGYVYNLGQTNITVGFVPFQLPAISYPLELYRKLFGEAELVANAEQIESIYGTAYSFQRSCQAGSIGTAALEPKELKDYMVAGKKATKMPNYSKAKEDDIVSYKTQITWLLAMLNNEEFWTVAGKAADDLLYYESGAGKARMDRKNKVQTLLDSGNRRYFIEGLIPLVRESENGQGLSELAELVNKLPSDNFSYFLTLIRFRYAEKSASSKQVVS